MMELGRHGRLKICWTERFMWVRIPLRVQVIKFILCMFFVKVTNGNEFIVNSNCCPSVGDTLIYSGKHYIVIDKIIDADVKSLIVYVKVSREDELIKLIVVGDKLKALYSYSKEYNCGFYEAAQWVLTIEKIVLHKFNSLPS